MTYAPIQGKCPVCHQDSANTSFQAGAASRDAEIARLLEINSNICERSNRNITEIARLEKERDQLRAHINTLTEALEFCSGTSYIDDAHRVADEALITKIPTS